MIPTLKDVAERAGVSRSAVSRCFTEGASVSKKCAPRWQRPRPSSVTAPISWREA
ncbi:LacI family DNA-binding transcriptional regulator [Devosia rhodophyticola]|uniref:LacI family DNA-binding transcriptional regulator n=1 Tax=Devosia rhodophyticola TaxID=3026423 RepID=A0ABY7YUB0_9HYPH|nr:LacI family DNA-binding transcriptional regulator [Devosia rhodophyticola]WDR04787.1 LacI family DNA-binding transcriptional regulator [Devosia rhodophyticola]